MELSFFSEGFYGILGEAIDNFRRDFSGLVKGDIGYRKYGKSLFYARDFQIQRQIAFYDGGNGKT